MTEELRVKVDDGKYEVIISPDGSARALRYGEEWQDLTGNKFIVAMAIELDEERKKVSALENPVNA